MTINFKYSTSEQMLLDKTIFTKWKTDHTITSKLCFNDWSFVHEKDHNCFFPPSYNPIALIDKLRSSGPDKWYIYIFQFFGMFINKYYLS